jgi:hypothetical protein
MGAPVSDSFRNEVTELAMPTVDCPQDEMGIHGFPGLDKFKALTARGN